MVRQIAPVFFTMDIPATLAYYTGKLGFECLGTWQDPPVYAIVARDQQVIHFRCAQPPTANPDKYGVSSRTQLRLSAVSGANVVANGGEGSDVDKLLDLRAF